MQKTLLIDDLDGKSEAASTVFFGVDGVAYEIDLSAESYKQLRDTLTPYMSAARATSIAQRPVRGSKSRAAEANRDRLARIRSWASENGYKVSERGRISADVVAAYDAAMRQ